MVVGASVGQMGTVGGHTVGGSQPALPPEGCDVGVSPDVMCGTQLPLCCTVHQVKRPSLCTNNKNKSIKYMYIQMLLWYMYISHIKLCLFILTLFKPIFNFSHPNIPTWNSNNMYGMMKLSRFLSLFLGENLTKT